jgi:membrane protein
VTRQDEVDALLQRVPARYRPAVDRVQQTALGRLLTRTLTGLARIELFDRAMTLAAQAFTSVLPVIILIAVLRPRRPDDLGSMIAEQLSLPPSTREALLESLPEAAEASASFGLFGVLVVVLSATSFSRALERMYARVWDVPRPGLHRAWRWLAALLAVVVALVIIRFTRGVLGGLPYSVMWRATASAVVWAVVWTLVPWLLLKGQVALRLMAAGGIPTGIALALAGLSGSVYLPIALTAGAHQFGALGIAFTYIGWLFVVSMIVVVGAVLGHASARDEGWLGRVVRADHAVPQPVARELDRPEPLS